METAYTGYDNRYMLLDFFMVFYGNFVLDSFVIRNSVPGLRFYKSGNRAFSWKYKRSYGVSPSYFCLARAYSCVYNNAFF